MQNTLYKHKVGELEVTLRYPSSADAKMMCDYINRLSFERTFIRAQGEQITLEEERIFLANLLKNMAEKRTVALLAFIQDLLVGFARIEMHTRVEDHIGELGISIDKSVRGKGIGSLLMAKIMEEAVTHLENLEIITLCVFSNNVVGKQLYEKFGFIEYGVLPKGIKFHEGYTDHILMYKAMR